MMFNLNTKNFGNWQEELQNSQNTNGLHLYKFYIQRVRGNWEFITFKEYFNLLASKSPNIREVPHVGFKQKIDEDFSLFTLFTTKTHTWLPGVGRIQNIKLVTGNIFQYVNPIIGINTNLFSKYYTLHNNLNNFPTNIKIYPKERIVDHGIKAFVASHINSLKNDILYIEKVNGTLIYDKISNLESTAYSLGMLNQNAHLNFQKGLNLEKQKAIFNFKNQIAEGIFQDGVSKILIGNLHW